MSEKKQTVDLGLLEEDDEFEEFPAEGGWILCVILPARKRNLTVWWYSDSASS